MSDKKHIDDLFREGISGYSVSPEKETWQNIEGAYFATRGSSHRWIYYTSAAVIMLLAGLCTWYFVSNEESIAEKSIEISTVEPATDRTERLNEKRLSTTKEDEPSELIIAESSTTNNQTESMAPGQNQNATNQQTLLLIDEADTQESSSFQDDLKSSDESNTLVFSKEEISGAPSLYSDVYFMNSISLSLDLMLEPSMIDPEKVKGMQAFLDKKQKSHFYTGLSATAGVMYYPSTKDQFTWSADIAFGITAGKFYFETGIGYQAMAEQGIYLIEFRSQDSIGYYNEVKSFEVNPLNTDEIIYKTEEVTVYDSINHYTHTAPTFEYNFINVPVTIGYRVFARKKLSIGVETGLLLSFMVSKEIPQVGFDYDEYTHVKTINMTSERVEINYRWQLAVRLNYRFARSMSVSVKPVFNKYLNSIYDTDKGYPNMKPYSMGLQVGLYYGF